MIGEQIGHFEIVGRAGRGGMGEVFIGEHTAIKTRVAIKLLHPHVSANTDSVQRFFNEARAVARIKHAGIVKIFDVGFHTDQRAYLIMELLEGESLAARLRRTRRLGAREAAEIARQVASILDATHHAGIIHRDLKPDNVFLVPDRELASGERVKLLDFGIAKLSDAVAATGPSTIGAIGTPAYMAPEQWSDSSSVDWRADVYSLGCIIYEMAAGRPPFTTHSVAEACERHLHETPTSMRAYAPDVPAAIDALALRLLAKAPADRVAAFGDSDDTSILALEEQLAALVATSPRGEPRDAVPYATADTTMPPVTTLSGAASTTDGRASRRGTVTALAIGVVAVIAAGSLFAWRATRSREGAAGPTTDAHGSPPAQAPIVDAPPAKPANALADWIEAANPFVDWHGAHWLAHQVTRREYRHFLESLPVSDALRFQPVTGWDDSNPLQPVAWITFERATAFCRALRATLPTSEQWLAASDGSWGLDPTGSGHPGPLQEWTATVNGGLVVVRGGHEQMSAADRAAAAREPLMKSTEAQAGGHAAPNVVAAATIGFRCVR